MGFKISGNSIDFKPDDNDKKYEPLPEGEYPVVLTDCDPESDDKGDRFSMRWTVDNATSPHHGRILFDNAYVYARDVSQGAVTVGLRKIGKILTLAGVELGPDDEIDADILQAKAIGLEAIATVTQREWQGKIYNNVKSIKPPKPAAAKVSVPTTQRKGFK
jgi:hypothetical protein